MGQPATKTVSVRRSHPRASLKTTVHFGSDSNFFTGFTNNVSEGGLFAATFKLQPLGSVVDLEFSLPDGAGPIKVRGEVCWLREYDAASEFYPGMGLRFLSIEADDRARIERFVSRRDPLFYDD